MKTLIQTLLISSVSFVVTSATADELSSNQKFQARYLFIIVMNGVRYDDAFGNKNHLYTENIWNKLRPLGTICTRFYNRELTYPIPAQASLLTGVWQIVENPLSDTIRPAFPTLFEYWKKKESGDFCYFATGKKELEILTYSDHKEYGKAYAPMFDTNASNSIDTNLREGVTDETQNTMYEKSVSYIFEHHPSFVYLNLDSGRAAEDHHFGQECKVIEKKDGCGGADQLNAYYESIILADSIACNLWDRIQHDEIYKNKSIFIFVSDHGRHTDDFHGFGDNCRGCQQLNFLIIGPGVKKDYISKKNRTLIDICPTVGTLFNLPTPYAKGKIMKEILE